MDKQQLRNILQQPYKFDNWKQVVDFVFPNVSYFRNPQFIPHSSDIVKSFRQLGSVRLNDGKNLAVFEVNVVENKNILRNRVELRSLVTKLIDQERNHGVLVVFEQGKENYRFSFVAKETGFDEDTADFVQRETDRKRFTYVLGSNESCRTATDRFFELSSKKNQATIKDVESAFSVERLSKEFFTKYKAHYAAFVNYLAGSNYKVTAFGSDEKRIRDFVKVLLGRIVFLHFVQKKGWLGASDTQFADGDKNFMLNFWNQSGKNENFYTVWLATFFFDALNKDGRRNQEFAMPGGTTVCVPFLGGGLFEKDRNEPEVLSFPPQLFGELFNFFGEYNFTIDENDPYENEVGIDPEMLGHIFENLLEDNKDKGAFYTPKPIVKYMCQESLIQYLLTQLEQNGLFEPGSEAQKAMEEKLGNFVKKYEAGDLIEYDSLLAKALHTIKVCDPAIGSGAFPMGILNEMVMLINVLHQASPDVVEETWKMDNWQPATVKKHIIQNSIYGVDIEKGAVDIARLRFWLSLVLDEEKPSALPSLDYKIVVGNSLLGKLGDDIIDIDWSLNKKSNELFGEELAKQKKELLKKLISHQRRFYTALGDKKEVAAHIRKLKIDLLLNQLDLMLDRQNFLVEPKAEDYRGKPKAKFTADYNRYLQCMGWQQQIERLKSLKAKPDIPLEFFDWKLDFPEVMNEQVAERVGFDVVIGNPPYINVENLEDTVKGYLFENYRTCIGRTDIFIAFIEISLKLIKKNGVFSFIIPYAYTNQNYGAISRKSLLEEAFIREILDTSEYYVFDSASVKNIILSVLKSENLGKTKIKIANTEKSFIENSFACFTIDQSSYSQLKDFRFETKNIFQALTLKPKIWNKSIRLDEICLVAYGARLNHRKEKIGKDHFIFKDFKEGFKPFTEGKNISRFTFTQYGWLDYQPQIHYNPMFPELFENEKIIFINVVKDQLRFAFDRNKFYNSHTVINCVKWELLINSSHITVRRNISKNRIELSSGFHYYFLLGILNSKIITWYFNNFLSESMHFYPDDAKELPVPNVSNTNQYQVVHIVNQILSAKQSNPHADTTALEQQIDNLVYRLYDLTYEEVKVIDPEFGLSEEEYNSIKLEE